MYYNPKNMIRKSWVGSSGFASVRNLLALLAVLLAVHRAIISSHTHTKG
jgi:hypothetical protein